MKDEQMSALFARSDKDVLRRAEEFTFSELLEFIWQVFPADLRGQVTADVTAGNLKFYARDEWDRSIGVPTLLASIPMTAFDAMTLPQVTRYVAVVLRHNGPHKISTLYSLAEDIAKYQRVGWDEYLAFAEHINIGTGGGPRLISALYDEGIPASYLDGAGTNLSQYYQAKDIEIAWRAKLPAEYLYDLPSMSREYTASVITRRTWEAYPELREYLHTTLKSHPYTKLIEKGNPFSSAVITGGGNPLSPAVMKVLLWLHGVSAEYARAMEPLGVEKVLPLSKAGVSTEYAKTLSDVPVQDVIGMWNEKIPLEYARAMKSA